jgi:hypothetical protein
MSLADMYEKIAAYDGEVEDQYEELSDTEKLAAEHDAAGRIMARGFMDELNKIAQMPPAGPSPRLVKATGKKSWEMPTPKEMPKPKAPPKK